ncbi:unnamed protein product [Brassica rapa subsp. trilocularis]
MNILTSMFHLYSVDCLVAFISSALSIWIPHLAFIYQ